MRWSEIDIPWQVCIEESWEAFCAGTVPIGAAIFDRDGRLLARARNHIRDNAPPGQIGHHDLAHAEVNALLQIDRRQVNTHTCTLYTAVEPCPLCMGALYMMGIYDVRFIARDTYAGATDLLGKTWYLAHKPVHARGPVPELEDFMLALQTTQHCRMGYTRERTGDLYDRWHSVSPRGVERGWQLFDSGELQRAAQAGLSPAQVMELVNL